MATVRDVLENVREEDFVEYFLFSLDPAVDFEKLLTRVTELADQQSQSYIWQKDDFKLIHRNASDFPPINDNQGKLGVYLLPINP